MKEVTLNFTKAQNGSVASWLSVEPYGLYYQLYCKFLHAYYTCNELKLNQDDINKLDAVLAKQRICDVEAIATKFINQVNGSNEEAKRSFEEKQSDRGSQEIPD